MSNPIKAIIILKEDSGGDPGCGAYIAVILIIAFIVIMMELDLGFIAFICCALMFFGYLFDILPVVIIAGLIILGGIWGWGKLQENGAETAQKMAVEKEKQERQERLKNHDNWKKEYYERDRNRIEKIKESPIRAPDSFKENVKKLKDALRNNDTTKIGGSNDQKNENSLSSEELSDNLSSQSTVDKKQELQNDIDLSSIDYPSSFLTTADSQFLAADGKETVIPANTRITIIKRTPAGMLTLETDGKTYLGYESRLKSKLIKPD
jgi:hypothetical protein